MQPLQKPAPGKHLLCWQGDALAFSVTAPDAANATAFLRTNIGHAGIRRRERIEHIESGRPILHRDWHDYPMQHRGDGVFDIVLPLTEVGRFEAKALVLPRGSRTPVWPEGGNTIVKVEPADTCCANTIYSAFVRQFGDAKQPGQAPEPVTRATALLDTAGYTVIPRSGTFRDLIAELDFIIGALGCRILQLLPIHATPTVYARMGRFGSPFAALDYKSVDPALAEFDRKTTPLQQFRELLDAVHARGARLFLDIPANHTGWASRLQINHPEWFVRREDESFESPGAWGVTWEDLSKLDYRHVDLWRYMANVFRYWCGVGVDGFRCDAGYMLPCDAWEYIVARIRQEFPDTVFLLEGLGGKIETMNRLLTDANLDWAYSELFQNYDRAQIEHYLPGAMETSRARGTLISFAETHDNPRLAAVSPAFARLRTALTALCSDCGAFGFTNGVEWLATEKINVHEASSLNWGAEANLVEHLARLNALLQTHPCFHAGATAELVQEGPGNGIALLRTSADARRRLIVLANLDAERPLDLSWRAGPGMPDDSAAWHDLLQPGRAVAVRRQPGGDTCRLEPAEVLCLEADGADRSPAAPPPRSHPYPRPARAILQMQRAKALEILHYLQPGRSIRKYDPDTLAAALARDPYALLAELMQTMCRAGESGPNTGAPGWVPLTTWTWPEDVRRVVMTPPGHFLLVRGPAPFRLQLRRDDVCLRVESSIPSDTGGEFALLTPLDDVPINQRCRLHIGIAADGCMTHAEADIRYLAPWDRGTIRKRLTAEEALAADGYAVCANGRGAMAQVRAAWGEVRSQYDALLAANLDPRVPVDRQVLFTCCRAWVIYQGYSQALDRTCLISFGQPRNNQATWRFGVPVGSGLRIALDVTLTLVPGENQVTLTFERRGRGRHRDHLKDTEATDLILRPDIDDRRNHEKTKAYLGKETAWPAAISPADDGFHFQPGPDHALLLTVPGARFTSEPEWRYMVPHPVEADRGLDTVSDHFSPGYFRIGMRGGTAATLTAGVAPHVPPGATAPETGAASESDRGMLAELESALDAYVVARDDAQTVIAGYPWFLDWGRDTLICLRGMIAAGRIEAARAILLQFARFEAGGTLPNVIRGNDISNRDTSDAPLWFLTACRDLVETRADPAFLTRTASEGRTVLDVLRSIVRGYLDGTPNGIRVDPDTGLVYSPSHFTWMDTNYPAGTPRAGYPIELQALWYAGLCFLNRIDPAAHERETAARVKASIQSLYPLPDAGYLSDCLHADPGTGAAAARPDNAIRPNQLFAITLGAVDDPALCRGILTACEQLLVPGGIRSLADRPVAPPLPIERDGHLLNDPRRPYRGQYRGDEDTNRKPAYHNGTAWTWPFPSYCEALVQVYGDAARPTACALLASAQDVINSGCIRQVPEILDGDAPHTQRGCGAQAWGVTELYRVLRKLTREDARMTP